MRQDMPASIPGGGIDLSHLAAARPGAGGAPGAAASAGSNVQGGAGGINGAEGSGGPHPGTPSAGPVQVPSLVLDLTDSTFEQAVQWSTVVPVVIDLWAGWCEPCKQLSPVLEKLTLALDGRLILAKVDVDANPGLAQAFQAQSIPMVVALVGGRPVPLFNGNVPEQDVQAVFDQLLQLAAQNGVNGTAQAAEMGEAENDQKPSAEPQIPEAHVAAMEAAERGDYAGAVREWESVLTKAPADKVAKTALAQVKLLERLDGASADDVRARAANSLTDVDAQMMVADLDVAGGHIDDAFARLLEAFASASEDDRSRIRERLLDLFEVVGADPRVNAARSKLASLLY